MVLETTQRVRTTGARGSSDRTSLVEAGSGAGHAVRVLAPAAHARPEGARPPGEPRRGGVDGAAHWLDRAANTRALTRHVTITNPHCWPHVRRGSEALIHGLASWLGGQG